VKIFWGSLIVLVLQASVYAADKITIAYPVPSANVTMPLSHKKGFLKEEGLEAQLVRVSGGAGMATLVNGEVDYYTVTNPAVPAAIQGLPVKVVACFLIGSTMTLVARPEFKSVKELKGKSIAVGLFGGAPIQNARLILKHFALDPEKDVKFVTGGTPEANLARLKQGLFDATSVPVPFDFYGQKMGLTVLARAYELFSYPSGGLVTTTKKIKERPEEIKRVIKAGIKANRYMQANRDETIQFLMESLKTDREVATVNYKYLSKAINDDGSLPEKGFQVMIEEAKQAGKVVREISLSEVADLSILKEAQRELGIKPIRTN
jgi:ABC-type nitrate/sulfonate/bicarbonate transport system substrate-binding protein